MNSKEALKELTLMINREKHINSEWNKKIYDLELIIKKDLDKLEKLKKENKELKKSIKSWNENVGNLLKENIKLKKALSIDNFENMFINCELTPLPELEELQDDK